MGGDTVNNGDVIGRELCDWGCVDESMATEIDVIQKPKEPELTPRECTGCWCYMRKGSL